MREFVALRRPACLDSSRRWLFWNFAVSFEAERNASSRGWQVDLAFEADCTDVVRCLGETALAQAGPGWPGKRC